jgi:flagellar protein FliS
MWHEAHDAYLESKILSADPLELVRLLYGAATDAVREARRHLAAGEISERSRAISKALEILFELSTTLDHQNGGEISVRLAQLYDYMQRRLIDANLQQADEPLVEVLGLLSTLSEGWAAIGRRSEPVPVENPWMEPAVSAGATPAAHAWSF